MGNWGDFTLINGVITLLITGDFCAHLVGMLVVRSDDFPLRDNPAGVHTTSDRQ